MNRSNLENWLTASSTIANLARSAMFCAFGLAALIAASRYYPG